MPTMDEGDVIMQLEKLPSVSLDQSATTDLRIQQAILEKVRRFAASSPAPAPTSSGSIRWGSIRPIRSWC